MRKKINPAFSPLAPLEKVLLEIEIFLTGLEKVHPVRRRSSLSGFTLIELITVIFIIIILVSLSIPQYIKVTERSRQTESYKNIGVIRGSQLRYYAENSVYVTGSSWTALDVEQPIGVYFSYSLPQDFTWTATCVARATRDAVYRNPGYGAYTIDIAADGTVTKSSTAP